MGSPPARVVDRLQTTLVGPHPALTSTACMIPRIPPPSVCATCELGQAAGTTAVVGDFAH